MHVYSHLIGIQEGTIRRSGRPLHSRGLRRHPSPLGRPRALCCVRAIFSALELLLLSDKHAGQLGGVLTANDLQAVCVAKSWASG